LTQILISKKFEKEIVFESSVLAWIRIGSVLNQSGSTTLVTGTMVEGFYDFFIINVYNNFFVLILNIETCRYLGDKMQAIPNGWICDFMRN
jgi:hypothetical protein